MFVWIYIWVTVHRFLEVGQRQWLCTKRGGVFEGGNSRLILCLPVVDWFPLYFPYGVENERCMHLLPWYRCCCMNTLGKGRPPPERDYSSLDQGQHTIPAPPTSVVFGMQRAGEGKPGQVGGCRRRASGGPEWPGRMDLFCRAPPCWDGLHTSGTSDSSFLVCPRTHWPRALT